MTTTQGAVIIDAWNHGEIPLLLAQSSAVSHGVNLQYGGSSICWFTLTYNLETYEQFIARVYRQGQTQKVFVYHLVANKTIDTAVLAIVAKKDKLQQSLLTALAEYWAL
jgi:SNF2 family DNA or RNA helicase